MIDNAENSFVLFTYSTLKMYLLSKQRKFISILDGQKHKIYLQLVYKSVCPCIMKPNRFYLVQGRTITCTASGKTATLPIIPPSTSTNKV